MSESGRKSPVDLDRFTVPELTALIQAAEAMRTAKMEDAKAALVSEFREKAAALGVPLESLLPGTAAPQPARKTARRQTSDKASVKYRNPETGDTWSGRGREPRWLKGKNRADFAVEG